MSPRPHWVRFGASLALVAMGAALAWAIGPAGLLLSFVGAGLAAAHGARMLRGSKGRYDLSELERVHDRLKYADELEGDDGRDRELAYCHRCGTSTAARNTVCPSCGAPFGT